MPVMPKGQLSADAARRWLLLAGFACLAISFGMGRYFYTPMLVEMQDQLGLSLETVGLIATWNLAGYVAGSLVISVVQAERAYRLMFGLSLVGTCVLTLLTGMSESPAILALLRFLAGMTSALALVSATVLVRNALPEAQRERGMGLIYCGVGAGMAGSGLLLPLAGGVLDVRGLWFAAGGIALVCTPVVLLALRLGLSVPLAAARPEQAGSAPGRAVAFHPHLPFAVIFICYAVGSICLTIFGTFVVDILMRAERLMLAPVWIWILCGLLAIPSGLIAAGIARRIGADRALLGVYLLHGLTTLLLLKTNVLPLVLLSGAIFGLSFMATPILVAALTHGRGRAGFGLLTVGAGIGQALTPFFVSVVAERSGGYADVLLATSLLTLGGCALLYVFSRRARQRHLAAA